MLLVDSEAPMLAAAQPGDASQPEDRKRWQPWLHLKQRKGDDWDKPTGSEDLQCHLMVQCMEAWLLTDRETLKVFFGQGFKDMSPAIDAFETALLNRTVQHNGHPVLTACASNAVTTSDPAGNRKLDKIKATGRIDLVVAAVMAYASVAQQPEPQGPAFIDLNAA